MDYDFSEKVTQGPIYREHFIEKLILPLNVIIIFIHMTFIIITVKYRRLLNYNSFIFLVNLSIIHILNILLSFVSQLLSNRDITWYFTIIKNIMSIFSFILLLGYLIVSVKVFNSEFDVKKLRIKYHLSVLNIALVLIILTWIVGYFQGSILGIDLRMCNYLSEMLANCQKFALFIFVLSVLRYNIIYFKKKGMHHKDMDFLILNLHLLISVYKIIYVYVSMPTLVIDLFNLVCSITPVYYFEMLYFCF